jgi:hypothetical protein
MVLGTLPFSTPAGLLQFLINSVFPKSNGGGCSGCRVYVLDSSVCPTLTSSVPSSVSSVDVTPSVYSRSALTPFSKDFGVPEVAVVPRAR